MTIPGFSGIIGTQGEPTLYGAIAALSLTSGLKLCLDAGDAASYTSGQSWLDRSGNGYDFFRGATSASEASDPTFNGVAGGQSTSEYFSFDGGDYFRYDSTNESWMNNLPIDSAKFSFAAWVNIASGTNSILGTTSATGATGISLVCDTTSLILTVYKSGGFTVYGKTFTITAINGVWAFLSGTIDEAANSFIINVNGVAQSATCTYTSPPPAAGQKMEIGAQGNAVSPMLSGSKMAGLAIWESVGLTAAQLDNLFQTTRQKFGV